MLFNQFKHPSQQYHPKIKTMKTIGYAITAGFTCSMGGVATGMIMVPYLTKYLPRQRAVGTSVAAACVGCLIATMAYIISGLQSSQSLPHYALGFIYLPAYAALALGSMIGIPLGIKLSSHIKLHGIKIILAILLTCSAISILFLNDIFFESFSNLGFTVVLSITAAETTGPAKHPLPTSSTPAVIIQLLYFKFCFFISNHFKINPRILLLIWLSKKICWMEHW